MSELVRVKLLDATGREERELLIPETEAIELVKRGLAYRVITDNVRETRILEQSRVAAVVKKPQGVKRR